MRLPGEWLVIGSGSLTGSRFIELVGEESVIYGAGSINDQTTPNLKKFFPIDITDEKSVTDVLAQFPGKFIINFAGATLVDEIEKTRPKNSDDQEALDENEAYKVNVLGTRYIAQACQKLAKFPVFISTGFVFDGNNGPYSEEDAVAPSADTVSWYAWTKILAEQEVQKGNIPSLTLRISYPYRFSFEGKTDFARTFLKLYDEFIKGERKEIYPLFADQKLTPTLIDDIPSAVLLLIEKGETGIFHITSPTVTTPYDFCCELLKVARHVKEPEEVLKKGNIVEFQRSHPEIAKRPVYGGEKSDKITTIGFQPTSWQEGIHRLWVKKRALITGITGQDGSYLTELLLSKNYEVAGLIRRNAGNDFGNINHLKNEVRLYHGDLQSPESVALAMYNFKPDEIYNLAAQSSPLASFNDKIGTMMITGIGAVQVFDRAWEIVPEAKIYQASTSEMFGAPPHVPQNEQTPIVPANPYAAAKAYAHWMANIARKDKKRNQFIACGILFNHESPRRGLNFVTHKITAAVACIKNNKKQDNIPLNEYGDPIVKGGKLTLGNLQSKRDWGDAPDYVEVMYTMLQQDTPDDFVIATGETHTVEEFCEEAFAVVGLNWKDHVITDPSFIPPVETGPLCGDPSKAEKVLGWKRKTTFKELVAIMVHADLAKYS